MKDRLRRRDRSLRLADTMAEMVLDLLVDKEEQKPRSIRELARNDIHSAIELFKTSREAERQDLPDPATQQPAGGQPAAAQRQTVILTREGVEQRFGFLAVTEPREDSERALGPSPGQSSEDGSASEHRQGSIVPDVIDAAFVSEAG